MTQKELLYMEDAVGHEDNLVAICNYFIEALEDDNLKSFMKAEKKKHEALKTKLLKVMEDAANEW